MVEIGGAIAIVVIGGIALHEYESSVKADAVSSAVQQAQGTFQKQLAQQASDFDTKLKERDQQYIADTRNLNDKFAEAAKNQMQMTTLLSRLGNLPVPITVTTPAPTKENPNPASVVAVPENDFQAVVSYAKECEQCKLDRTKLAADFADRAKQAEIAQQQIDSLKKERDVAVMAAKGGTKFQRVVRTVKIVVIAGATGYLLGHKF